MASKPPDGYVGFPPWGEPSPGNRRLKGSPVHSGFTRSIRAPGQPIRSAVVVPESESIIDAYHSLLDNWENAPGLQDKRLGDSYLCYRDSATGGVLQWQIPGAIADSPSAFYDWLAENGFDEDEPGFFLYCDNSPDIPIT